MVKGRESICPSQHNTGFNVDGGFAEYMVAERTHIVKIPESISSIEAAPIMCAGLTVYSGLKAAHVRMLLFVVIVDERQRLERGCWLSG
jgi:propanol-preferring alcohol dehydrogenase